MPTHSPTQQPKREQGSVLLIGMIFLVVLMIGATSIMNSAVQDERITGNTKTSLQAFFAAEAGYREMIEHLEATDQGGDNNVKQDRWDSIASKVSAYSTQSDWEQADIDNKVSGFNAKAFTGQDKGKSEFTVKFSPVFDDDGNRVSNKILFFSEGKAGQASRTIGFELEGGSGNTTLNAPAAISCFGSGCKITAGAGNDSVISGRNHPVPDASCSGNSCWKDPYTEEDNAKLSYSVPAAYLTHYESSTLGKQGTVGTSASGGGGGGGKPAKDKENGGGQDRDDSSGGDQTDEEEGKSKDLSFIGQDKGYSENDDANEHHTSGPDKTADSVWVPSDYPVDENGKSTAPSTDKYFGNSDSMITDLMDKAGGEIGDVGSDKVALIDTTKTKQLNKKPAGGVLIIDGSNASNDKKKEFKAAGTGFFAGLVVIKGCAQWSSRGNFTIYGAVIVDATGCGDDYFPFDSKGTPDLKYSSEALDNAGVGSGAGSGFNGNMTDWYEVTGY
ncbi:pilus assembly PilX N-terminal domain-containing protein [Marinobacterium sp. AK62]|uniref:Pilus assembly PilX N-terminal domain-containing protein n=1 Tax=Marinobacterium alkalitolerans TaxID=1542925 RepID=A0ABS3ZB79_9GAMM|nr:pilus assembly PilX N-terminal domain-containing protein [Marinobacterium alkalitolerans]MBP0048871.1 pilus assembly PilX N-terminal domain-containing protein [Marinobacterium alkalitolerans]